MPTKKPTPDELPSTELVLTAIGRAERHRRSDGPGVLLADVKEHLALRHTGWTTRQMRPQLTELESHGLVKQIRRHGLNLWGLTPDGRQWIEAIGGDIGPLPESPQHKKWREARAAARERIPEFRAGLHHALTEANALLETTPEADSDTWFERGASLNRACRTLASATHCLYEWPEPSDARADIDDSKHRGRREIGRWDSSWV